MINRVVIGQSGKAGGEDAPLNSRLGSHSAHSFGIHKCGEIIATPAPKVIATSDRSRLGENPTTLQPTYSEHYHILGYGNFEIGKLSIYVHDAVHLHVEKRRSSNHRAPLPLQPGFQSRPPQCMQILKRH